MQPLVLQLQAECLNSGVTVSEILRKALVAARKLSLIEAEKWIEKELKGYKSGDSPPAHRLLEGRITAWNPYHEWTPIVFQDQTEAEWLSKCFAGQPVGELEDLLRHRVENGVLEFPFDGETESKLMKGLSVRLKPTRHVSRSAVAGILEAVRHMILELCLQLERDGIPPKARLPRLAKTAESATNSPVPARHSPVADPTRPTAGPPAD